MFDLSWTELLVIGVAAIVFMGPKELPSALRTLGRFASKARSMAREFQNNVEDMVREAELDEVKKQVEKLQTGNLTRSIESTIDPKGEIASALAPPELPPSTPSAPAISEAPPPRAESGSSSPPAVPETAPSRSS